MRRYLIPLAVPCALAAQAPIPAFHVPLGETRFAFINPDGDADTAFAGAFVVPHDRRRSNGPADTLVYVRLPARTAAPGPPTVYLTGGPGGSGIDDAAGFQLRIVHDLRAVGDVVLLDQRGTGRSTPNVTCPGAWDLPADHSAASVETARALQTQARRCAESIAARGIDLSAYTTAENADDVGALRAVLGARTINLYGFSYGSHLALEVVRRHREGVGRVVIGGVEGAGQTYKLPLNHLPVLVRLDSLVRADPRLSFYIPNFLALVDSVRARLRARPAVVKIPIRTLLRYDERGFWRRRGIDVVALFRPTYAVVVGEADLDALTAVAFGRASFLAELPALYYQMSRGDFQRAALLTLALRKTQPIGSAMGWVTDCQDGVTVARRDSIARQGAEVPLVAAVNWPFPNVCAGWIGLHDAGDSSRAAVGGDTPVLAFAGALDGRTPLAQVRNVVSHLRNARLVTVDNAAHSDVSIFTAPEVRDAVREFLRDTPVTVSHVTLAPIAFVPPVPIAALLEDTLYAAAARSDSAIVATYWALRAAHPADYVYDFAEPVLNRLGYRLLREGRTAAAVRVFELNVSLFPRSFNAYDSLGEAQLRAGDRAAAIVSLRRAIEWSANPHSYRLLWEAEGRQPPAHFR